MSSGPPPASAWDANNLVARYDRYRVDLAKISEAPSEEFDLRIAGDAYGSPESFRPLPPSGPGYPLHVDFVALGRKLKALRGLLIEGDYNLAFAASSCLDIILAMRPFAMDNSRWQRYIEEHHQMDLAAMRGSRNRHGDVRTRKGIVPDAPLLGETAIEYAAKWFLKLANDPNQVQNKLRDYTHVLEDLANYAKTPHRGPGLHFYVVRWLLAVRSQRYNELVSRYGPEIFGPWHRAPAGLHERSRSRSQSSRRRSSSHASRRSRSRAQSHHRGHSASPEDAWSDEEELPPRPPVADLPRRRHDFDDHWMTDSQYEVAVLQVSVKNLRSVVDAMSARVEKLLELGPVVERLLRRTERLPQFVDAGLDRLSQEDRQACGVAVPSAAPALAALPPNPRYVRLQLAHVEYVVDVPLGRQRQSKGCSTDHFCNRVWVPPLKLELSVS
ncbi:hypothetical protein AC1031_006344 [Aphanomyces cochlioides]|nr:hypothetical protein AC1031_006344 [Aphanomyces cochlioides]